MLTDCDVSVDFNVVEVLVDTGFDKITVDIEPVSYQNSLVEVVNP